MIKFRQHRGGLDDSMATVVEVADLLALLRHIESFGLPANVDLSKMEQDDYGYDGRIGWATWIITVPGYGVLGFTDCRVPGLKLSAKTTASEAGGDQKIDWAAARFTEPEGQTLSPGQPAGPLTFAEPAEYDEYGNPTGKMKPQATVTALTTIEQVDKHWPKDSDSIDEFQAWMRSKPLPTGKNLGRLPLLTIGLGGEAGEAIELLKKHLRDDTPIDINHLILELGDVAIIISLIAKEFEVPMSVVLAAAKNKIAGRIARGTLRGAGDDR